MEIAAPAMARKMRSARKGWLRAKELERHRCHCSDKPPAHFTRGAVDDLCEHYSRQSQRAGSAPIGARRASSAASPAHEDGPWPALLNRRRRGLQGVDGQACWRAGGSFKPCIEPPLVASPAQLDAPVTPVCRSLSHSSPGSSGRLSRKLNWSCPGSCRCWQQGVARIVGSSLQVAGRAAQRGIAPPVQGGAGGHAPPAVRGARGNARRAIHSSRSRG